jgi:hypothetical protein
MYRRLCILVCFALAAAGSAEAAFNTVGVYDPNDAPFHNQVDQSGTYESHTGDAGPQNVIDLATFRTLLSLAFPLDAGGVVDIEIGSLEGQNIVAKYGVRATESLTITSTSGTISTGTESGTSDGARLPTSGKRRFSKSDTGDFVFDIGSIAGGVPGEMVTYFAGTLIYRNNRNMNPHVTATFSGGGTVAATADMVDGAPANSKDTFFGFVAPPGQRIVNVNFDLASFTFMDDVAFITSALNPEPALAWRPFPAGGMVVHVKKASKLTWLPGVTAASHDVYFGDNLEDVNAGLGDTSKGNQKATSYSPAGPLELGKNYFWRIDEVQADGTTKYEGHVWSFTTAEFLSVDDFEDYNNYPPYRIFETWIDGWGSQTNGSIVGHSSPDFVAGESFVETKIVHGDSTQSVPYYYNNDMKYSEATMSLLGSDRDWTRYGVKALSLWFRGYPPSVGSFVQGLMGTYTMTGAGTDIWYAADEFHFAWKMLDGPGSITAKVESITGTNLDPWAKAGVMIRETLDPNSTFAAVYITGANGCRYQARVQTAALPLSDTSVTTLKHITAPHWIRLEREFAGNLNAYDSNDGVKWFALVWNPVNIQMKKVVYVGLALTSHQPGVAATALFSNVSTTGTVTPAEFTNQDIGILSNQAEPMYVAISNNGGAPATVYHPDPNAVLISQWTQWNIALTDFARVDLKDVDKIAIGFGNKGNIRPGGSGLVYFDDIALYRPRCLPAVLRNQSDINTDCVVDIFDLQIMAEDWLKFDRTATGLLGQWQFEGNTDDSSGNGHHGDVNGAPVYAAGRFRQALDFDGDGDYVQHSVGLPSEQGTIAHWLKPRVLKRMIAYYEGSALENGWTAGDNDVLEIHSGINETTGQWYFCYEDGPGDNSTDTITAAATAQADVWTHVAATWDRTGSLILYADGVEIGRSSFADDTFSSNRGIYHRIGGPSDITSDLGKDRQWIGLIDDVRIYDRALTPAEIQAVMNGQTLGTHYYELTSPANLYNNEPVNSKKINFRDYALLADSWLQDSFWPQP